MPFGQYRGRFMALIPPTYLKKLGDWIEKEPFYKRNPTFQEVLDYINTNRVQIEDAIKVSQKYYNKK